jgi:hypothetical protein
MLLHQAAYLEVPEHVEQRHAEKEVERQPAAHWHLYCCSISDRSQIEQQI